MTLETNSLDALDEQHEPNCEPCENVHVKHEPNVSWSTFPRLVFHCLGWKSPHDLKRLTRDWLWVAKLQTLFLIPKCKTADYGKLPAKMCCLSSNGGLIEVELYSRQKITTPDAGTTSSRSCRCARLDHFRCGGCNIHTCANYLHRGEKQTPGQLKRTKWGSCESHLKWVSHQSRQILKHWDQHGAGGQLRKLEIIELLSLGLEKNWKIIVHEQNFIFQTAKKKQKTTLRVRHNCTTIKSEGVEEGLARRNDN